MSTTQTFTQQAAPNATTVPCATVVEYGDPYYYGQQQQHQHGRNNNLLQATHLGSLRTVNNNNSVKPKLVHVPSSNVIVDADTSSNYNNYNSYTNTAASAPLQTYAYSPNTAADFAYATTTTNDAPRRTFRGRPVKAKNAHLPDSILAFKKRRQAGTAVATWASGVTGFVLLGPLGAFIGATAAYGVTKSVGKRRERKLIQLHQGQQAS